MSRLANMQCPLHSHFADRFWISAQLLRPQPQSPDGREQSNSDQRNHFHLFIFRRITKITKPQTNIQNGRRTRKSCGETSVGPDSLQPRKRENPTLQIAQKNTLAPNDGLSLSSFSGPCITKTAHLSAPVALDVLALQGFDLVTKTAAASSKPFVARCCRPACIAWCVRL